jgi:hypothetical protein
MSGSRIAVVLSLLLMILLAVLGWLWFDKNFERHATVERTAMSVEARRNPLLAAEMFLARLGMDVESQSGRKYLIHPPDTSGLLFVRDLGPPLPQYGLDNLLAWVERGGHLVVSPGHRLTESRPDLLLQKFGVTLIHVDEEDEVYEREALHLPGQTEGVKVDFAQQTQFVVDDDFDGVNPIVNDPQFLVFPWGSGRVTMISDREVFTNQQIAKQDHARLLAYLAPEQRRIWLLYSAQMPSLLNLTWQRFPYLVLTLVTLGLLILWWLTLSTGPKLALDVMGRRDLLEHLQASAEFAWRYDLKGGLLEGARQQVERRWLSAHPMLITLDQQARCEWLAQRTGMTSLTISRTLYPEKADPHQLIKNTINLQRLLAALHPDRKVK